MHCTIKTGSKENLLKIDIEGNATWETAHHFFNFVKKLISEGKNKILIDLKNCNFLDSTYFGVLAEMFETANETNAVQMFITNENEKVKEEIETLGLDQILNFATEEIKKEFENIKTTPHSFDDSYSKIQKAKQILKAHQTLERLNEENKEEFRDVIDSLQEFIKNNEEDSNIKEF